MGMVIPQFPCLDTCPQIDRPPDDCLSVNGLLMGDEVVGDVF